MPEVLAGPPASKQDCFSCFYFMHLHHSTGISPSMDKHGLKPAKKFTTPVAAASENIPGTTNPPLPFLSSTHPALPHSKKQAGKIDSFFGAGPTCNSHISSLGAELTPPVHVNTFKCVEPKQEESHLLIICIEIHWHLTAFCLILSFSSTNEICCCSPDY